MEPLLNPAGRDDFAERRTHFRTLNVLLRLNHLKQTLLPTVISLCAHIVDAALFSRTKATVSERCDPGPPLCDYTILIHCL